MHNQVGVMVRSDADKRENTNIWVDTWGQMHSQSGRQKGLSSSSFSPRKCKLHVISFLMLNMNIPIKMLLRQLLTLYLNFVSTQLDELQKNQMRFSSSERKKTFNSTISKFSFQFLNNLDLSSQTALTLRLTI